MLRLTNPRVQLRSSSIMLRFKVKEAYLLILKLSEGLEWSLKQIPRSLLEHFPGTETGGAIFILSLCCVPDHQYLSWKWAFTYQESPNFDHSITWLWRPKDLHSWSHGTIIISVTQKGEHASVWHPDFLWVLSGNTSALPGSGGQ